MRTHGVPDFPDPSGGGLSIQVQTGQRLEPAQPDVPERVQDVRHVDGHPGHRRYPATRLRSKRRSGNGPAGGPGGNGGTRGLRSSAEAAVAEVSAKRIVLVAALASALVGGAVAGGVAEAVGTAQDHEQLVYSSSGDSASVATARVERTNLQSTVQVGGSISYRGSYVVAAPGGATRATGRAGPTTAHPSPTSRRGRPDRPVRHDRRRHQAVAAAENSVATAASTLSDRPGTRQAARLRGAGERFAGVQSRHAEGQPGPHATDPGTTSQSCESSRV